MRRRPPRANWYAPSVDPPPLPTCLPQLLHRRHFYTPDDNMWVTALTPASAERSGMPDVCRIQPPYTR